MNLILFEPDEVSRPLPRRDPRAVHILEVLRRAPGETFDAGIINGPRGKGTVTSATEGALTLAFAWGAPPARPPPLELIVGLPRPQTARDILREAATLGVTTVHVVLTDKTEPSYGQSSLWHSGEWRRRLIAGAEQAFDTWLPEVRRGATLPETLATLPPLAARYALDNYESPEPLGRCAAAAGPVALAIGAERGWSARERAALREHAFQFVHLGTRVLRTESAVVAGVAIIRSKQGLM